MVVPKRVVIAGSPRSGKSTLSLEFSSTPKSTDDVMDLGWSEASQEVSTWFDAEEYVVEGVAVPRAMRKWFARHADDDLKPCDLFIWMPDPRMELSRGQESMRKGCATVMQEIWPTLRERGVEREVR